MRGQNTPAGDPAIDLRALSKSYGDRPALRDVSLQVRQGESLAVFGPNGAGKTTLVNVLATLVKPSSGSASVTGFDVSRHPGDVRRRIGVVSHQTLLYGDLTARENLKFYGKMYDVDHLDDRIGHLLDDVGLGTRAGDLVQDLSRGMQQRLAIARALLHDPPVVLLDEPGTGLDEYASAMLANILDSTANGRRTVVMTTHSLEQGLALSSRVAILAQGRIAFEESRKLDVASLREVYFEHTGVRG
jgi:heme ABC exporter ATP-binding subunit CcmA